MPEDQVDRLLIRYDGQEEVLAPNYAAAQCTAFIRQDAVEIQVVKAPSRGRNLQLHDESCMPTGRSFPLVHHRGGAGG